MAFRLNYNLIIPWMVSADLVGFLQKPWLEPFTVLGEFSFLHHFPEASNASSMRIGYSRSFCSDDHKVFCDPLVKALEEDSGVTHSYCGQEALIFTPVQTTIPVASARIGCSWSHGSNHYTVFSEPHHDGEASGATPARTRSADCEVF